MSSGENLEKIAANSVFIHGEDIWVATDKGLAQSSLTLSNLQAPDNWTQYTTENGLLTNQINQVVVLDSIPYVATKTGVERFINERWQDVGLLNANVLAIDILKSDQFLPMQTVVILTSEGVLGLNSSDQWQRLGPGLRDVTALKTDADGNIWIGRKDKGLATYSFANNDWQLFETNSPASNNFKGLALDSKGRLWCVSQVGGIHMLDGNLWTNFSTQNGLKSNDQRTVLVDSRDRIWFGSWGGGVTIFEETANSFAITQIDTTDGILAGSDTPAFVVVNHLTSDQFGNVWILNRQADNTRILVANTPDNRWVHFSTSEGIFTPFVLTAAIDRNGRVWIGTEDRGIKVLDYNNTLFDKSDDDFTQGLDASEGLFSNKITAIIEDKDGVVWIGTEEGVNSWFGGQVRSQFGLINDFVNTIGVDARNNKWFGTANGVSVLGADDRIETHYTTGNSSIINGNIQSFAFNEETGEVWIGTTNGLSRLQTPFTTPKPNLSLLSGYPNPFVIDANTSSGRGFKIINLAENTTVVIYNSAGAKIKTLKEEIQGAQVEWLGRDEKENLVPSGVYIYLAFT
ncbi:MAG: two-component regulator propeller domain-containing protein, partial [bacterium]